MSIQISNLENCKIQISNLENVRNMLLANSTIIQDIKQDVDHFLTTIADIIDKINFSLATNQDIKQDLDHLNTSVMNIIDKINLTHDQRTCKANARNIIDAIQKMCSRINPDSLTCGIDDFQKIIDMCDTEHQKLFVLYCCIISYAREFAEQRPYVAFQYYAAYDDNRPGTFLQEFNNRYFLSSEEAFLMVQQIISAYYNVFESKTSHIDFYCQNPPLFGFYGISIIPNYKISDYVKFFIDFKHTLLLGVSRSHTISFHVDRFCSSLIPYPIIGGCSSRDKVTKIIKKIFLY